ncbi:MAG: hypothetical protein PVG65_04610 [Candidatus Thorarchaeota archaeon]|jgi:hypothetical protein
MSKGIRIGGEFYFDTWYEIFVTKESGETQTIDTAETINEAKQRIKELEEQNPDDVARKLLNEVEKDRRKNMWMETGGFRATKENGNLYLQFIITSCHSQI